MNFQPTLQGELLRIEPLRVDDFERLYQAASDPLIWELHPKPDRYKREFFQKDYFDSAIADGCSVIAIDQKTNEVAGCSRYYDYKPENIAVSIGYTFLARKYWGGKYNFEFKKLMIQHAFQSLDKVIFEVGAQNLRSQKAMEKIGGILISREVIRGIDHVVYEINKNKKNLFAE